jgi:hypothetical protein
MPVKQQYIFATPFFPRMPRCGVPAGADATPAPPDLEACPQQQTNIESRTAFSEKLLKISGWRQSRLCVIMKRIEKLL